MSFLEAAKFFIYQSTRFVSPPLVATEWVLVAIAAALVAFAPFGSAKWLSTPGHSLHRLASHKRLAILICGLLPIAIRVSLLGVLPVPEPTIHDEFSHLLLADTLAHGRFTNPTHPMWRHFESIHIIQQPTYNSMYPPAPAMALAVGQVVFGDPWAGVVIVVGLMCAATCWMMQGWMPPAWAFHGTLIAVLRIGVLGFWMNSYVGGSVPAIGGALLFGALPRLRRESARPLHAVIIALGLVILMNSRPFEGAALGAAAVLYLLPTLWRRWRVAPARITRNLLVPAAAILAAGFLFTGFYSWKVTGSPLRMPYQVNRDTYGWPENLGFLPVKEVTPRHQALIDMYQMEIHHRDIYKSAGAFLDNIAVRLFDNWTYFLGPVLTIPLLFLPGFIRGRKTRPLILFLAIAAGLNAMQMVLYPYHLGPVVPVIFAVVAECSRRLYFTLTRTHKPGAPYFLYLLPLLVILVGLLKQFAPELGLPQAYWERAAEPHGEARAGIGHWLSARPGKQLVIVRYSPGHSPNQEWVYNRADIDGSKVVWAREMDPDSDAGLLQYFRDREVWLLEADSPPPRVIHYARAMRMANPETCEVSQQEK